MSMPSLCSSSHYAWPANSFHADFGVFRGEVLGHVDEMIPGDIYLLQRDASATPVRAEDETQSAFCLERAANMPVDRLETLANLIFMTTTGRRVDMHVAMLQGQVYIVSDAELSTRAEYVLVSVEKRDAAFKPIIVQTPAAMPSMPEVAADMNNVIPLRMYN